MDERIRRRRRAVTWQRGRGRRTVVFLAVLALCIVGAFLWLRNTDVFAINTVTATGAERVTRTEIAAITAGVMGRSLLSVSTADVEEALRALPYVESAEVHRGFPNTLEIELEEYRPVARLQDGEGEIWLVSDSGKVLDGAKAEHFPDLPLLVPDIGFMVKAGEHVPATIADILPLASFVLRDDVGTRLPELAQVTISAAGCAALVLAGGGELRLGGPVGLERKLSVALDIVQQCLAQGRVIEYIDASVADRVAVKAK